MFDELRKNIKEAFPLKPTVSYRLSQAIIDDDYGDDSYAFKESWTVWDEIEDWQVARCYVLFSFAPANVSEYLLPRYMIFFLDQIEGKISESIYETASDVSGESAVFYIQGLKSKNYKNTGFNKNQISVLENFLTSVKNY